MSYVEIENMLSQAPWDDYIVCKERLYGTMKVNVDKANIISECNYLLRSQHVSCKDLGLEIKVGDICFIDYGQQYINEIGYQHFGLVMNICCSKALVIPMTSNAAQYRNAYDKVNNPTGKLNLMRIGQPYGLTKPSVLFLNDAKYINTARIIEVMSHIDEKSPLFRQIQQRMLRIMFDSR